MRPNHNNVVSCAACISWQNDALRKSLFGLLGFTAFAAIAIAKICWNYFFLSPFPFFLYPNTTVFTSKRMMSNTQYLFHRQASTFLLDPSALTKATTLCLVLNTAALGCYSTVVVAPSKSPQRLLLPMELPFLLINWCGRIYFGSQFSFEQSPQHLFQHIQDKGYFFTKSLEYDFNDNRTVQPTTSRPWLLWFFIAAKPN